ncbi:TIGR03083 family protein [Microlunatus flavus]|uniref:TIGR03083 family protein n=1 Tax=Microlunatus flavus TaxID=1036181 RepID=A0A1H9KIR5_9ACTN|nr:TIGR03083 family protein [Microlunatus flavus]
MRARRSPGEALVEQGRALHDWLADLTPEDATRPTVLEGWDVHALLAHLDLGLQRTAGGLGPEPGTAEGSRRRALEHAERFSFAALLERLDETLDRLDGSPLPPDVVGPQAVELVVHADDLSRSLPDRAPVPQVRGAVGVACRSLCEVLATRYPGRSVEVRVPPHAAVQCSVLRDGQLDPGPTHTRGTPPNVVETDATTFLRMATGRTSWANALASGRVAASGLRADLSEMLPLVG